MFILPEPKKMKQGKKTVFILFSPMPAYTSLEEIIADTTKENIKEHPKKANTDMEYRCLSIYVHSANME